jgi:DNA-binding beta-propeller fold protein YncE
VLRSGVWAPYHRKIRSCNLVLLSRVHPLSVRLWRIWQTASKMEPLPGSMRLRDSSRSVQLAIIRPAGLLALAFLLMAGTGCGDYFRPIAIPEQPVPPAPAALHYMLSLSSNGLCPPQPSQPCGPGSSNRIDVSGDTSVGAASVGRNPVHAVILPNADTVYVADQMDDTVSFYAPGSVTPVSTISLPAGSQPVVVAATDNNSVYVASPGNNSVYDISTSSEAIVRTTSVGQSPVALAELPNTLKVYVANRGSGATPVNGSVQRINTVDNSISPIAGSWNSPVWMVARSDNNRVYALDQGTGVISAIDTATDSVVATATLQPGANFIFYDKNANRLYVTNPVAQSLVVLDASTDSLTILANVSFAASSAAGAACPNGCTPLSVTVLPDDSRAYVASYFTTSSCTQPADTPPCVLAQISVLNASNYSLSTTIPITLTVGTSTKPDTPELAVCDTARFRIFTAASADSTRVYMSYCDAGATAVIRTNPDTSPGTQSPGDYLVTSLTAPPSDSPAPGPGLQPPPQNPVFVVAGP